MRLKKIVISHSQVKRQLLLGQKDFDSALFAMDFHVNISSFEKKM